MVLHAENHAKVDYVPCDVPQVAYEYGPTIQIFDVELDPR